MVKALGRRVTLSVESFLYFSGFFWFLMRETFSFTRRRRIGFRVLIMQIYFTGVEALSVIGLISLAMGAVIIIQGVALLPRFGQGDLVYNILILIITRELGPLITALVIVARSGSAITTELGNMVISHEMEAYMSVGLNPISLLGVPRVIGVTAAMFLLNIYFNIFGLLGSYIVSSALHSLPASEYLFNMVQALTAEDLIASVLKSIVFGIIIASVAVYHGFQVKHAVTEVPQRTIKSIGQSIVWIIIADGVIAVVSRL